jgi:hypothetical protein
MTSSLTDGHLRTINGMPNGTTTKVAIGAASTASAAALTKGTTYLVTASSACHIVFAAAPTAAATDCYIPADTPLVIRMTQAYKVAVIQATAAGNLYLTPLDGYAV